MSFALRDVAMSWGRRSVQDAAGVDMGVCIKAFADDATGPASWLVVELPGGSQMAVPMAGTTEVSGIVRVAFLLETVITAPTPTVLDRLSPDDAARLYDHYGLTQPAAASPTLPAAADVPTPSRPPSVPPPAAKTTAPLLGTGGEAASASGGWGRPGRDRRRAMGSPGRVATHPRRPRRCSIHGRCGRGGSFRTTSVEAAEPGDATARLAPGARPVVHVVPGFALGARRPRQGCCSGQRDTPHRRSP